MKITVIQHGNGHYEFKAMAKDNFGDLKPIASTDLYVTDAYIIVSNPEFGNDGITVFYETYEAFDHAVGITQWRGNLNINKSKFDAEETNKEMQILIEEWSV